MLGLWHLAALLLLVIVPAQGGFSETIYTATLAIDQVIPIPNDPPPTAGIGVCIVDRYEGSLDCEVQTSLPRVLGAHIGWGKRGANGIFMYEFSGDPSTNMRDTWKLDDYVTDTLNVTTADQVELILNGQWYIQVSSDDYPAGILRGQIEHTDRVYARLDYKNTIPHASGTAATGLAAGTFSFSSPLRELDLDVVHTVYDVVENGAEIRLGKRGDVGPMVNYFSNPDSPMYGSITYTPDEMNAFLHDLHYLNIISKSNPSGEVRGQLTTIDYVADIAFTSRLNNQELRTNTDSRGCGLFAYDCTSKLLEYLVMHNSANISEIYLCAGSINQPSVIEKLEIQSPIYGSVILSPQEELLLYRQQLFVIIVTPDFPQGEISGLISVQYDWWAYLSGTNVVAPVTTSAVGCATMHLEGDQNRILDYEIMHNLNYNRTIAAMMSIGKEGENGVADRIFPYPISPIRGNDIVMDDDELEAFVTDRAYFLVTTDENPYFGEIRGTIKRVNPCVATNDNVLTISVSDGIYRPQGSVTAAGGSNSNPEDSASALLPSLLIGLLCISLLF